MVPQYQKSKGWLILTAALELSRNQITHFYSLKKNTEEMIKMVAPNTAPAVRFICPGMRPHGTYRESCSRIWMKLTSRRFKMVSPS